MQRFFLLVLLNILNVSISQAQELFFQEYNLLKKSEPVQVNKIVQDKIGFIWLGTDKGLFKFNGKNYKRFSGIDLPDENVTSLAEDSLGRIWVGFKSGKIAIGQKDKFIPFEPAEGMPKLPISDILFDNHGTLWFSTLNDGTYYFLNERLYRLDDIDGMPDLFCYDLELDADGNIWVGTDGGVAICKRTGNSVEIKKIDYASGLPDNIVKKILKANNGNMILASQEAGIAEWDKRTEKISSLRAKWNYGSTNDLLLTADWLWVATERGLVSFDLAAASAEPKTQSNEQVNSLFADVEGNVWLGTRKGLIRTLGEQLQFVNTGAVANVIALTVDASGNLWYSDGKTLIRQFTNGTRSNPLANSPFHSKSVISLFTDADGFIWAGLYGDGALRIDPKTNQIKVFSTELRNGSVLNITWRGKKIWLATLGGASEIDTEKLTVKNYSTENGLSTDYIYQVFVDHKNRTWFATDRNGVDMLDANGFHHFNEGFEAKVIYGFAEDAQQHVWANVQDIGLLMFDEKKFTDLNNQKKMHSANVSVLVKDPSGRLIAAHESGIDFFDASVGQFHFFGDASGLENSKPNLNAVAQDGRGRTYIGSDHGIIVFSPRSNILQSVKPLVDLFKVDDKVFDLSQTDQLSYDQNNITINFIGFWFQNPDAISFSYKLENFDADWISTLNNSVTYSRLPPGDYIFHLKASDDADYSSSAESTLHFVIKPPFWRTYLFYVTVVGAIVVAAYFFVYLRQRKLMADKRELEVKVLLRTLEIENKTMEIQAQAEEIKGINENLEELVRSRTAELEHKNKALEDYAFINAHQLRAPVASILGLIHLMQKLDLKGEEKEYVEHLKRSAKKLDEVVTSITEAIERGDFMKPL